MVLLCIADPSYQTSIVELELNKNTVSKTIAKVTGQIWEKAYLWIKFPSFIEEICALQRLLLQAANQHKFTSLDVCTKARFYP